MVAERGEFKGNKMIILKKVDDDKYPIQFGYNKAQTIVDHMEEIKQFVSDSKAEYEAKKKKVE